MGANFKNVVDGLSSYSFNNYYDKDHHDGDLMSEGFFQCTLVSLETKKGANFWDHFSGIILMQILTGHNSHAYDCIRTLTVMMHGC